MFCWRKLPWWKKVMVRDVSAKMPKEILAGKRGFLPLLLSLLHVVAEHQTLSIISPAASASSASGIILS
jgi:hypothetical protein